MHIDGQTLFIVHLSYKSCLCPGIALQVKWSNHHCLEQDVVLCGDMGVIKSPLREDMSFYECSFY